MAEGEGEAGPPSDPNSEGRGPAMEDITSGLMLGQSKSTGEEFLDFPDLENPREGKNKFVLVCQHCKCRVLRPGYGTLVDKEV